MKISDKEITDRILQSPPEVDCFAGLGNMSSTLDLCGSVIFL